jgi:hypothetical protein
MRGIGGFIGSAENISLQENFVIHSEKGILTYLLTYSLTHSLTHSMVQDIL